MFEKTLRIVHFFRKCFKFFPIELSVFSKKFELKKLSTFHNSSTEYSGWRYFNFWCFFFYIESLVLELTINTIRFHDFENIFTQESRRELTIHPLVFEIPRLKDFELFRVFLFVIHYQKKFKTFMFSCKKFPFWNLLHLFIFTGLKWIELFLAFRLHTFPDFQYLKNNHFLYTKVLT